MELHARKTMTTVSRSMATFLSLLCLLVILEDNHGGQWLQSGVIHISKPVAEAMGPSVFVIFIFFGVSEDAFTNKYSNFNSNIAIFVEQDS